jgi:16S rRNA (guanine527-N7)-methyltransferase
VSSRALEELASGAQSIVGRALTQSERERFDKYLNLLRKWQRAQRLVGSTDPVWIVEHLFLDSLLFLRVLPEGIESLADIGSGAGVPGIPIGIVRPQVQVVLIESRERRASFLTTVVRELGLRGVRVLNARAERVAEESPAAYSAVVMRCAGDLGDVLPAARRLVASGGVVVASGPPGRRALTQGEWIEVPGVRPGSTRRFAVHRV